MCNFLLPKVRFDYPLRLPREEVDKEGKTTSAYLESCPVQKLFRIKNHLFAGR